MISKSGVAGLAALFSVFAMGNALAGAELNGANSAVLVNTGSGFKAAETSMSLKTGDRVMVSGKSAATVSFPDGCSIPLQAGIVTIGDKSPCSFKAQEGDSTYTTLFVGLGAAALIGGGIYLATRDDDKPPFRRPVSP